MNASLEYASPQRFTHKSSTPARTCRLHSSPVKPHASPLMHRLQNKIRSWPRAQVAEEVLTLSRIVRTFGTESHEGARYGSWLRCGARISPSSHFLRPVRMGMRCKCIHRVCGCACVLASICTCSCPAHSFVVCLARAQRAQRAAQALQNAMFRC